MKYPVFLLLVLKPGIHNTRCISTGSCVKKKAGFDFLQLPPPHTPPIPSIGINNQSNELTIALSICSWEAVPLLNLYCIIIPCRASALRRLHWTTLSTAPVSQWHCGWVGAQATCYWLTPVRLESSILVCWQPSNDVRFLQHQGTNTFLSLSRTPGTRGRLISSCFGGLIPDKVSVQMIY